MHIGNVSRVWCVALRPLCAHNLGTAAFARHMIGDSVKLQKLQPLYSNGYAGVPPNYSRWSAMLSHIAALRK